MTPAEAIQWERIYRRIQSDPFALCRLVGFEPTPQQCMLLGDVWAGHKRVACKSGQGTGKTTVSALIGIWRAIRRKNARVIVTAPSMRQCQDVWMVEARKWINNGPKEFRDLFHITSRKIYVGSKGRGDEAEERCPAWGVQCVTASNPVNAQGYHDDTLSFIVEEASGVPRPIIEQIEGTMSQPTGDLLHLQIGNPNTRDCSFYDSFHSKRAWWRCHTFNAKESPRVDKAHIQYMEDVYGANSDVVRVRILGEFPKMDPNAVMAMEDLEACTRTDPLEMAMKSMARQFGIDLARFGSDESAIGRRHGHALLEARIYSKREPMDVVAEAFTMEADVGWGQDGRDVNYVADADGMGQGVMGLFRKAGKKLLEFHSNGRPYNRKMFANRMTEAWFNMREYVRNRNCYIPNDPELLSQLAGRLYALDNNGLLKIEKKEDYKKRTESNSPDRADMAVMAFYDRPAGRTVAGSAM